jgi:cold shock protein
MRITGKVKWFDSVKGYGFIQVDGREKDIFFHAKQWNSASGGSLPVEGETLVFTEEQGPKGAFATEIARQAHTV